MEHTGRGRAILYGDGELIGWVIRTTVDGGRAWSVSTLDRWSGKPAPISRAATAEAAVEAWAAWVAGGVPHTRIAGAGSA